MDAWMRIEYDLNTNSFARVDSSLVDSSLVDTPLEKLDHVDDEDRLHNACPLVCRPGVNYIAHRPYMKST